MTPEQREARDKARAARSWMLRAQKDYEASMREAFSVGVSIADLAHGLGMRYDAVRMYRRRLR